VIKLTLWLAWFLLLFLVCFGLGYPTLNRYSPPATHGLSDSLQYFHLVEHAPHAASGHWKYRILVPFLAKPIYWMVRGHVGSWNPVSFALLVVNSIFCAAGASLLSLLAFKTYQNAMLAVIASLAYLLNFTVANLDLSGLVDSAEAFWFLALTWSLMTRRWVILPLIGLFAGLSKETFVPVAFVFATVWLVSEPKDEWTKASAAIVGMTIVGLATVMVVRSTIDHTLVTPWQIAAQEKVVPAGFLHNLGAIFVSWSLWLTLAWLPFLFFAAKRISKAWYYAAAAGAGTALALGMWNNASGSDTARPIFNVLGPLLALSFALTAQAVQRSVSRSGESLS